MTERMAYRYAVYYAAPPASPLEQFGTGWLGRDHRTCAILPQPAVPGIAPERLHELTAAPRRYGFHGTLKAPFRLAEGHGGEALHEAVAAFAGTRRSVTLPPLVLADLDGFLALVPAAPAAALDELAADCVRAFDRFRAPLTADEIARRPLRRLTERQRRQLETFGYPYIFEDFAFHMTLTERLAAADTAILRPHLQRLTARLASTPFVVDALAVFEEPAPGAAFVLTGHYSFRAI